jgi:ABC-2 type transport system ATP-binding protein
MNNVLEVRGLNKSYEGFALKDVSFEIPAGYIMGFIGPNGAGKTTTIKSILNMLHDSSGEIKLFGLEREEHAGEINEKIGVVMDSPLYVDDWSAADVETAVAPFYPHWDSAAFASLLKRFSIEPKKKVKELSRGMKVKLMVAVALSHQAELLILDEPTSGLDPVARDELCDMLADFVTAENRSILFSTHITSDLEKIADYVTFILDGKIVFTGPKEELMEKYVLIKGGLRELNPEQRRLVIGLREHATGFDGMAEAKDIGKLPKSLLVEPISLEEIVIYMNKGVAL